MPVNTAITLRKGSSSQWNSTNPVLASGEPGYDLTNNILKIGDGVSNWDSLSNHKHSSIDISNFNSSVSGLLPTIANPSNNRLLISDGSSFGIQAQSNLSFNGSTLNLTPTGVLPADISSNIMTINSWRDQVNNVSTPKINFNVEGINNTQLVTTLGPNLQPGSLGDYYFPRNNGGILIVGDYNNITSNYLTKWENQNHKLTNSIIFESGNRIGIGTASPLYTLDISGITKANSFISTRTNNTTNGGGQIYLNGTVGNRIDFNINGSGVPSFTTRSVGTKVVLSPEISASTTDYALGIEFNSMWFSVPSPSDRQFKWYAGTSNIATLNSSGILNINGVTSQINVDNLRLDNNVLSATIADSDLILFPNGNGSLLADPGGNLRGIYSNDFQRERTSVSGVAAGSYNVICGGSDNRTANSYSIVCGGQTNVAGNSWSMVGGGDLNNATGNRSVICGGGSNVSSAQSSTVGGGSNNQATGVYSIIPGGFRAKASRQGELSHSAGFFNALGDAQHTILITRRLTTDATADVVLTLNGSAPVSTNILNIPAQTMWTFGIKLSAYNVTNNEAAWWIFRGGIKRNNANSTILIGSLITENGAESTLSTASATVVADDTNESLEIRVTGVTGKSIRWVAVVDISQVSFGTP